MTKILVLDAGHGLYTAGKETMNGSKGVIKEWTLNNSVCNKIEALLKPYDVKIYRTDDPTGKTDVSLSSRVKKTNTYKPDLFISIHHNAGRGTGTEVFYHTHGTAADKKVAGMLAPVLAKKLDCRNRGVKHAKFTVLTCQATAILVEGGFMDTTSDYNVMTSKAGQVAYAEAVAETVIKYLNLNKETPDTSQPSKPSKIIKGDQVRIKGSKYATGEKIPSWVKRDTYKVVKVNGNKALLDNIMSWVYLKDLVEVGVETSTHFLVEVKCNALNVRQSNSFYSKVVGVVKKGEVFTITKESNGLGKLKSGAGWISLNSVYVKRK